MTAGMPFSLSSFESVLSDSAPPVTDGKIRLVSPVALRASASTCNARRLSGTRCSRPVFARSAGTVPGGALDVEFRPPGVPHLSRPCCCQGQELDRGDGGPVRARRPDGRDGAGNLGVRQRAIVLLDPVRFRQGRADRVARGLSLR